jgi:predicted nucleic acid-binding protein
MNAPVCVLDASVGVKLFRDEPGSDQARQLLTDHIEGRLLLTVDTLFSYEVLRAASREGRADDVMRIWRDLEHFDFVTVPLGDELVDAAAMAREQYGCSLYDAFSAGLADLLEAPLYSADARAHGAHPRLRMLGE